MNINYHFEWDPKKALSNKTDHGISFDEAATIFLDPLAVTIYDPDHSEKEERWITMGISKNGRLLVVCHTFHKENEQSSVIRIISSRKANKIETREYGEK